MRRFILVLLFGTPALTCHGVEVGAGRWQGSVKIPGNEIELIVDLARDKAGTWIGSVIVPGMDIKGAPLADLVVTDSAATFAMQSGFGRTPAEKAEFTAHVDADGAMNGDFKQAGNTATFVLKKAGLAQVELPPRSTVVAKKLEGHWAGDYELGGYPRHITVDFANHSGAAATADVVVVGKKTTKLPIDLVTQEDDVLRIESSEFGINFEGKFHKESGEIKGIYEQGPFDLPLTLRREG